MATDHTRLRELFVAACDLSMQKQNALMDQQCADDPDLRIELQRLLRHDGSDDGILADDDITNGVQFQFDTVVETELPEEIGGYRIKRLLGHGGMGVVYLAQQENPRRDVALKVIRSGIMSRELLRRFEFEAAVLGRLQHPGIAKIHEAGMFDDGTGKRPFFAMDYVHGQSLADYIRQRDPSIHDRLKILVQICDAVHHAHQRGVIHRDLKPGNILVTGDGQTHILDFGVARATETDIQVTTMQTSAGQLVGTLPYMSPEQISGRAEDVDTRSDIYSLGVVLYELLVEKKPYELHQLSVPDAIQKVKQESPERISRWNKNLRGDVETIIRKSLEKDKRLRYQSASEFAADINRYLSHLPIDARPASTWYQIRKFARRNKGLVAAVSMILATLLTAGILVWHYSYQQSIAITEVHRQVRVTKEINDFLNKGLLEKANSTWTGKKDISVRTLLDAANETIDDRFEGMPQVEAAIRHTLGWTYFGVGEYKQSQKHLELSRSLYESELGLNAPTTIQVSGRLAKSLIWQWKLDEAEALCKEDLTHAENVLDSSPMTTAKYYETYGILLKRKGNLTGAQNYFQKAIALWEQTDNHDAPVLRTTARANLAITLSRQKKFEEAEREFRKAVEERKELVGMTDPLTALAFHNLANVLWERSAKDKNLDAESRHQKLDEADEMFQQALAIRTEALSELHPDTISSLYGTALVMESRNNNEAAEKIYLEALELNRKAYGSDEHIQVLNAMNGVGTSRDRMGRHAEAVEMFETAFITSIKIAGPNSHKTKLFLRNLLRSHRLTKNDVAISELLETYQHELSLMYRARIQTALAETLADSAKFVEAIEVQSDLCNWLAESDVPLNVKAESCSRLAKYLYDDGQLNESEAANSQAQHFRDKLKRVSESQID